MVCWKILILRIPELTLLIDLKRPESQGVWHQKYFLIPPPFFSWNIGFDVTPHSDSTFKVFLGQLVGLTQESLMLGFSNITFWNRHINWTLKTCAKSLIHFFRKSSSRTLCSQLMKGLIINYGKDKNMCAWHNVRFKILVFFRVKK